VSTHVQRPPRYIRIDNLLGGLGGVATDCDGKIIHLAELTLWNNGVALSISGTPVVMSADHFSASLVAANLVDGDDNSSMHTGNNSCDTNPWVYVDVGIRLFDQVVVTNSGESRINGARISSVWCKRSGSVYADRQYFPSTSAATFTFAFPEGTGALGGSAVSSRPDGSTTSSTGSTSAAACSICATGYELVGNSCVEPVCAEGRYGVSGRGHVCSSCPAGYTTFAAGTIGVSCSLQSVCDRLRYVAVSCSNARYVGKDRVLSKVRWAASVVMQASTPKKRLLHACRVV
jgi:hypothetical protein